MTKLHASILLALTILTSPHAWTNNADNAVILLYHHVSSTTPASTSVTPVLFEQHLQHLADGYNVISLEQAVKALKAGELLPERAVVITFDDGYRNIYDNAHPMLLKYAMPYTVFVNPQLIGKHSHQLNWQQVAEMEKGGAQFANHTSHHRHLLERVRTSRTWSLRWVWSALASTRAGFTAGVTSRRYLGFPPRAFTAICAP
jgi:hypothetical protein